MASNRLWVGGFDRYLEKSELSEVFQEYGPVTDVWVACDPPGYAFVEFETDDQAKAALTAMDQSTCLGCKITVQTSKKSGYPGKLEWEKHMKDKANGNRIYIGNIVEKVNVGKLNGAFEEFGNIVDISINKEGYAYIEFEREEEAARAVEETNGTEIFGGFLEVEITSYKGNDLPPSKKKDKLLESKLETRSESRPARQPESGPSSSRLFVGNLSRPVTKDEIEAAFKGYGTIKETWVPFNFKGFCFVEFEEAEPAQQAIQDLDGCQTLDFSEALKIELTAKKKPEGGDRWKTGNGRTLNEPRLFVGNIKDPVDKTDLQEIFEPYGKIVDIWVAFNPPGFAFVQFSDMESAQSAIEGTDGMEAFGGTLKVNLTNSKRGESRDDGYSRPFRARGRPDPIRPPRHHPYSQPARVPARRPPPFRSLRGRVSRGRIPRAPPRPVSRYTQHQDPYYDDPYYATGQEYADPYYPEAEAAVEDPYYEPAAPPQAVVHHDPYYAAEPPAPSANPDPYYYDDQYYRPDPLKMRSSDHPAPVPSRGRGVRARARARPPAPVTPYQPTYADDYY